MSRRLTIVCVLAALGLAGLLAGCDSGERTRRDTVPIPARPLRVICGTPAIAEIVFALGAGDRVVGVSDFTDWPPEADPIPRIGGALAPSRERILSLQPDLILSQGRAETLAELARSHGIAFASFPLDTLADLRAAIAGLAAILNVESAGQNLLGEIETRLAAIASNRSIPVFIALAHAPGDLSALMTTASGTFLHELVEIAGGENIFADTPGLWPRISRESLIRRTPALILDIQTEPMDDARRQALLRDWQRQGFSGDQIRFVEGSALLRPGPRAIQAASRLAEALHVEPVPPAP